MQSQVELQEAGTSDDITAGVAERMRRIGRQQDSGRVQEHNTCTVGSRPVQVSTLQYRVAGYIRPVVRGRAYLQLGRRIVGQVDRRAAADSIDGRKAPSADHTIDQPVGAGREL